VPRTRLVMTSSKGSEESIMDSPEVELDIGEDEIEKNAEHESGQEDEGDLENSQG